MLAIIAFTVPFQAQTKSFKIGIKASPNISWMKTENGDISLEKTPLNFGYGLMVDRMFTENYAIGTGVNIYNVGGMASYTFGNKDVDTTYLTQLSRNHKLTYLEVPLTLKLRTAIFGKLIYWGQFGFGLGYLLKAYGDDSFKVVSDNSASGVYSTFNSSVPRVITTNNDIQGELGLFRASMIASAGIEYEIGGSTYAMAGITYNGGLLSIYKSKDEVAKLTNGVPTFASDNMSFETTSRKIFSNLIELNIGIIF